MSEKSYSGIYLILSLKWSDADTKLVWWGPKNKGYTVDIDAAGRYTAEKIAKNPDYYDNDETTRAVRLYDVMEGLLGPVRRIVDATFRYPVDRVSCSGCGELVSLRKKYPNATTTCYNCGNEVKRGPAHEEAGA